MLPPYMIQQLARQKQDELRLRAEIARLAAVDRQTRRRGLPRVLRLLRVRRREAVAPTIDFLDRHSPDRFAEGVINFGLASSSPIRQGKASR